MKKVIWITIGILAILVSIIPFTYLTNLPQGFLELKTDETLKNVVWRVGFYFHIFSGTLAILTGWLQFNKRIRINKIENHRAIGKVYFVAGLLCSFAGLFIGFWAYGGIWAQLGFSTGALIFFGSTLMGYINIRKNLVLQHQKMMTISYAMCLGAINLRLFMGLLMAMIGDYDIVYLIISWFSWLPNLLIAFWITRDIPEVIKTSSL